MSEHTTIEWYPCSCGAEHNTPTCPFGAGDPLMTLRETLQKLAGCPLRPEDYTVSVALATLDAVEARRLKWTRDPAGRLLVVNICDELRSSLTGTQEGSADGEAEKVHASVLVPPVRPDTSSTSLRPDARAAVPPVEETPPQASGVALPTFRAKDFDKAASYWAEHSGRLEKMLRFAAGLLREKGSGT